MKIITLTLNPAFDLHCRADRLAIGGESLATVLSCEAGGKGINISRALNACGVENQAIVVLGEENAVPFRRALSESGMSWRELLLEGRIRENITIHTSADEETRISFEGLEADALLLSRVSSLLDLEGIDDCVVTLTGRLPRGLQMQDVQRFLENLRRKGAKIVLDSRSFSLEGLVAARPYLIKPNAEEMGDYLGRALSDFADALPAARELCARGIPNVMVSFGACGALLVTPHGAWTATPPPISAASTVGAGDSAIAGFLVAHSRSLSSEECLRSAVAFGSAACLREGTLPPRTEDVQSILPRVLVKAV